MKKLLLLLATAFCLFAPVTVAASASAAYDPLKGACGASNTASTSPACQTNGSDPLTGPNGVIKKVTLIIATIAGVVAVIVIIISGLRFVTANGDVKKAADARSTLIGAIIGLIIIAAAQSIIIFVVSTL